MEHKNPAEYMEMAPYYADGLCPDAMLSDFSSSLARRDDEEEERREAMRKNKRKAQANKRGPRLLNRLSIVRSLLQMKLKRS